MKRIVWFLGAFALFIKRVVLTLLALLTIAYLIILLLPPSVFLYMDAQDRKKEFKHYLESQNIDSATLACPTVQSCSGYCTLVISEDGFSHLETILHLQPAQYDPANNNGIQTYPCIDAGWKAADSNIALYRTDPVLTPTQPAFYRLPSQQLNFMSLFYNKSGRQICVNLSGGTPEHIDLHKEPH